MTRVIVFPDGRTLTLRGPESPPEEVAKIAADVHRAFLVPSGPVLLPPGYEAEWSGVPGRRPFDGAPGYYGGVVRAGGG